jgi:protein SCO1/2
MRIPAFPSRWFSTLGVLLALALPCALAGAQVGVRPTPAEGLTLIEHGGDQVPLDLVFRDTNTRAVPLANYFDDGRPVVLALLYYRCPVVCSVIMERMVESFNGLDYRVGRDFNVVYVSIDEEENPTIAGAKKNEVLSDYAFGAGAEVRDNWAFLTGDPASVKRLADAVGYQYRRLPNGEYAHPVAFAVLSPGGTISRYIYGYEYPPRQMKLALLDASEGKVAKSLADRVLHFCFRYDPNEGAYTLQAMRVMQLGGVLTLIFLGGLIGGFLLLERRKRRRRAVGDGNEFEISGAARADVGHES